MTHREHFQRQLNRGGVAFCASVLTVLALVGGDSLQVFRVPGWLLFVLIAPGIVFGVVTFFQDRCPRCRHGLQRFVEDPAPDVR